MFLEKNGNNYIFLEMVAKNDNYIFLEMVTKSDKDKTDL